MASKQSTPEIRIEAFIAAREKCALSVEKLAHLACLSKKQIQQIENGQTSAFYSPTVKFTAAKKVATLIQLDEKDAFDFGPQAELPFATVTNAELGISDVNDVHEIGPKAVPVPSEVNQPVTAIAEKKLAAPFVTRAIIQSPKQAYPAERNQNSSSKKWFWLLPLGALAVTLVQLQPLLKDQLDAFMVKQKPAEVLATPSAPPADAVPTSPSVAEANVAPTSAVLPPAPASTNPLPVVAEINAGCPSSEGSIETYKPPSAGKPGNVVFVRTNSAQSLCVVDADGIVQSKAMEPSIGHSFYGKPPFKLLSSAALGSAEVFFQGFRMRPNAADMKGMLLVQAD